MAAVERGRAGQVRGKRPSATRLASPRKDKLATADLVADRAKADFFDLSRRWAAPTMGDIDHLREGLSFDAIDGLNGILPGVVHRIVPKSTLAALKKRSDRLPPEQSDRVYQTGKVLGFAMSIYRDEAKVREFLERRHPMLQNRRPLDVAIESGAGADVVINLLGRGAFGGGA